MCLDAEVEAPQSVTAQRVSPALQDNAGRPVEVNGFFDDGLEEERVVWGREGGKEGGREGDTST